MSSREPEENRSTGAADNPIIVLDAVLSGDPNHRSRQARRRLLAAAKFCVHEAAGVSRAMDAAVAHQPDVVLLSVHLAHPGLSGADPLDLAEICRQLKGGCGKVPAVVLLVSAEKPGIDLPRCEADLCLPRNLAPAFLIEAVRPLLRMHGAERELSSVMESVQAARRDLDRSRGELVDFSMKFAHDIEGPLRGVVTFAELIGQAHPLSENERTYLRHVLSSADQVRRLARCLLTYAQAKRDPLRLAEVPLKGVVAAAVQALRERIRESAAVIHIQDSLPTVMGDFSALQQVVQNLVGNAINYRGPDSNVSITIGARQASAAEWLISVADNGIGVAKEYHDAIFAPFKRLHGNEIPGAGMGLALCKQIVEGHGGRIWVESEPGRGASFQFTLGTLA
jgi:signal transduction histidine kinase